MDFRGEGILRSLDAIFVRADAVIHRFVPEEDNPLSQSGAIANTTFLVAVASGVALLLWYSPTVRFAYGSVQSMGWLARFIRSVHRYASDACMCFVVLHATKLFFQRRFGGPRYIAWLTGAFLVGTLWLVGWLGYWLVWDERARQVALGTARMLDALPIFVDPLSRSFLADEDVGSMLFFIVFFVHMLVPLVMGIALWLHITRLSRPRFLASSRMTVWVLGGLAVASVLLPADVAGPARMRTTPDGFSMDAWYLAPLSLTDRLGAGALWAVALVAGVVAWTVPWTLVRGRLQPAQVQLSRCNACNICYADCPFDAIRMVPRTDGRTHPVQAQVDPDKCVACGICVGSCDSAGIGLPWFDVIRQRTAMDRWVDAAVAGGAPMVAFVCAESAAQGISIDASSGTCKQLPGYLATTVPCAGWVHALTVQRALRHGAAGVLVVGCGPGSEMYREGTSWTRARLAGQRKPSLDTAAADPSHVRFVELFRGDVQGLIRTAAAFRAGQHEDPARRSRARSVVAGAVLLAVSCALVLCASRLGYALPSEITTTLVVSFKHPGVAGEQCRDRTPDELAKLPPHMRQPRVCQRRRVAVRMRVRVDGRSVIERSYEPKGLWSDGNSLALERVPLEPGSHDVHVEIGDTTDEHAYNHEDERAIAFEPRTIHVVTFDKVDGFRWR